VVADILGDAGYECDVAYSPDEALQLLEDDPERYVLGVLDYQMPGMNGVELYERIQSVHPEFVGLFLTAHPRIDTVYAAINAGAERVLAKPVNAQELVPLVRQYAGKPEGR
jgi:DNA-binding NtrC family response regulator